MGYGERPEHALYLAVATVLFFAVANLLIGGLAIDCSNPGQPALTDFFQHSIGSFVAQPYLEACDWKPRIMINFETIVGVSTLAIFTAALGQRIGSR